MAPTDGPQAYSEQDFFRLMRTGKGLGDRDLGLMSEVSTVRFTLYSDDEVLAIRAYLMEKMQAEVKLAGT